MRLAMVRHRRRVTSKVIGQSNCNLDPNPGPTTNALPAQETGTKPARALPYQPNAWLDRIEYDANSQTLNDTLSSIAANWARHIRSEVDQ